jgi:GNAT superfamily N-acetyltransferase
MPPTHGDASLDSIRRLAQAMDGVGEPTTASLHRRPNPGDATAAPITLTISRGADESSLLIILRKQTSKGGRAAGVLSARLSDRHRCGAAVSAVSRRVGLANDARPFVVVQSELDFALRGRGIGAWLYAEAARLARSVGAVVLADDCEGAGNTSALAHRVWASQRIRPYVEVVGDVMGWRDAEGAPMPAPPGVTILAARANPGNVVTLYVQRRRDADGVTVVLYDSLRRAHYLDHVGILRAERMLPGDRLGGDCVRAIEDLAQASGVRPARPYVVVESDLADGLRGRGLGAWMYGEATRLAWFQARAPVTADACTTDGETSPDAGRVWDGKFLREVARVQSTVALWRPERRATPAPPGIRIREHRSAG